MADNIKKNELILLYVPFPNLKEATKVSKSLLSAKLIICANITPGVLSIYEENGEEKEKPEAKVLFKAFKSNAESLKKTIENMHSYDIPVILELNISSINERMNEHLNQL